MLLPALVACTCSNPPEEHRPPVPVPPVPFQLTEAGIPEFPDYRATHQQQIQLDRTKASWTLPTVELPAEVESITDEFVLDAEELPNPKGARRVLKVVRAELPFPVETDEQTFRPEGMDVTIDGKPIPFGKGPAPLARNSTWRITGKYLILSHPTIPMPGALKIRYPGVREALDRHDPAKNPEVERFVHASVTLRGETRHGLMLVAPSVAEWEVTLPPGAATFQSWLALEGAPIPEPTSDGAGVSLVVVADGAETVVSDQLLEGASTEFLEWKADLTPWAGKTVKLRLASSPRASGDTTFDWVFAGSPTISGPPAGDVRRVVVIALDTTRPDHLSLFGYDRPTTPELDAWANTGVVFDRAWSTAPRTRPSFRSSTTGRLPLEAVGATNIAEVFAQHGFATAGIVANVHLQPRFQFDVGFDSWRFDGKANAEEQVNLSLDWLNANAHVDSYLFVHFMDPHMIYDAPGEFREKFVTEVDPSLPARVRREQVIGMMQKGTLQETTRNNLVALHDGELAYTSFQLDRLLKAIDQLPGRSLVVLHSDHGEEFWEHGGFEHNHSLYDELTRTVLVMRPGGGLPEGRRVEAPVTLMDIAPTLYDLFGFAEAPPVDGRTLVPLLAGVPGWSDRPLPVGYLQYSHERWGVIWGDHKYILHTGTGREELYDLKADPKETTDLAESADLAEYRLRLHEAHGVPVGPGFRVRVELPPNGPPLVLELPVAPKEADVLDPESIVENRANIEWGETPKKISRQVGAVTTEGNKVTFQPGGAPEGVLYVLFDAPQDPAAVNATLDGTEIALGTSKKGRAWKQGGFSVSVEPGTVVVPPKSEADRMGIGAASDMDMLCKLGYVTEGCANEGEAPPEPQNEEDLGVDPDEG